MARISDTASEYEIRNAFSRSYYALFHAWHGYLLAAGINIAPLRMTHGRLHDEMEKRFGRSFRDFLGTSYESRRMADYVPEWSPPPMYKCNEKLRIALAQFYFLKREAQKHLED